LVNFPLRRSWNAYPLPPAETGDGLETVDTEVCVPENLGAALDTGNLHAAAMSVGADDVAQLGARIFDVHVKDMRGLPDAEGHTLEVDGRYYVHVPLGEGDVRNGETLGQLAAGGYTGWIANESECSWPDWDTSVAAARHEYAELNKLIQAAHA